MAGAPKGNKNAVKLKTPELMADAYKQYCDHIAAGGFKQTWVFEHPQLSLSTQTMEKYIKENPIEFNSIHKEIAESKCYMHWIAKGIEMMLGAVAKCQPAIYQMFMRNMFGWDKEDKSANNNAESDVRRFLNILEKKV